MTLSFGSNAYRHELAESIREALSGGADGAHLGPSDAELVASLLDEVGEPEGLPAGSAHDDPAHVTTVATT